MRFLENRILTIFIVAVIALGTIIGMLVYIEIRTGDIHGSITVDGMERDFLVHLPKNYDGSGSLPLLIALHGGGGNGRDMEKLTEYGFNRLADREGFIAVYPDGIQRHWNDGRNLSAYYVQREDIDDVKFISKLIDHMIERYHANGSRVYVTGMSNGALMTYRLAFEIPERIAAVAPVDGSIPLNIFLNESPRAKIPVLMINNVDDPILPWNGGYAHFGDKKLGKVLGVEETAEFWAKTDNCSLAVEKEYLPDTDPQDGTRVWVRRYLNNSTGMEVVLYGIEGGGHTWPSGYQYLPESVIGRTSMDIDACEVIWDFLKDYHR